MIKIDASGYQINFVQRRRRKRRTLRACAFVCLLLAVGSLLIATHRPALQSSVKVTEKFQPLERVGLHPTFANATITAGWQNSSRVPFEPRVPDLAATLSSPPSSLSESRYPADKWRNVTVAPGDNLSLIFGRVGANGRQLQAVLQADKKIKQALTHIGPGQTIRFRLEQDILAELVFEPDHITTLRCIRQGDTYKVLRKDAEPDIRVASAAAEISHSLFIDGQKAGIADKTILEFIEVFGWDVDFLRELQRGDHFGIVFEELYKDGQKIGNGKILAAEFVTRSKRLRAVYYHNKGGVAGYFADNGDAMKKTFLRTPVNFTRISSRFSLSRRHPILNTIRAHKGVDYAAPTGTPIQAVADGRAEFVGWQTGYGNVIVLKHADTYSTLYGHMSGFARGLKVGATIAQGQTIGFVGMTGLATGPHLHYEFRINGVHRDPLSIKFLNASAIDRKFLTDFKNQTGPLVARLEQLKDTDEADTSLVARSDEPRNHRSAN